MEKSAWTDVLICKDYYGNDGSNWICREFSSKSQIANIPTLN